MRATLPAGRREVNDRASTVLSRTSGQSAAGQASAGRRDDNCNASAESHSDSDLVRPARLTSAAAGAIVAPGGGQVAMAKGCLRFLCYPR
jgi:hypothetical protein